MTSRTDPYLVACARRPRIPDAAAASDPGDQSKTFAVARRSPPRPKLLEAGPLEAEVRSFGLHLAAEQKAARTIRNYSESVRWFAPPGCCLRRIRPGGKR